MNLDRAVGLASKFFATLLFVLSLLAVAVAVVEGDAEGLVSGGFAAYLTGLLAVGVFRGDIRDRAWQLAFFAGVAVWGGYDYLTGGDPVALLLVAVGVVMVAAAALGVE